MTSIKLRLTNATNTANFLMQVDEDTLIADLLSTMCQRFGFHPNHNQSTGYSLFYNSPQEMALYDARLGVFDPTKTLRQSCITEGSTVRWHYRHSTTSKGFANIKLLGGQRFHDAAILIVAEWQGKNYPIILPANTTPQGNVEGSLLSQAVFRQIADIEEQDAIAQEGLREWRYHNTRTRQLIDPYDTKTPLSQYFRYGDSVKLVSRGSMWSVDDLTDEISIVSDSDLVIIEDHNISQASEQDLLDQIELDHDKPGFPSDDTKNCTRVIINQTSLELTLGDITQQHTDAIVNAANETLEGGGGVDGAIHRAAGPQLVKASRLLAPCRPGDAVLTPGFCLPAKWVIHTVGPVYQGGLHGEQKRLSRAYRSSLQLACDSGLSSIAFPSISTGVYGYPIAQAAKIALQTVIEFLNLPQQQFKFVRFVLFSNSDYASYRQVLAQSKLL